MRYILPLLLILFGITACRPTADERLLDRAEQLLVDHPDSALSLVERVVVKPTHDGAFRTRYNLMMMRCRDKAEGLLPSDSLLEATLDYYEQHDTRRNLIEYAYALYYAGRVAEKKGDFSHAMAHLLDADRALSSTYDTSLRGDVLMEMARLYRRQRYVQLSSIHFEKAARCFEVNGRPTEALHALMATSAEYHQSGEIQKANRYYHKAQAMALELNDTVALITLARIAATRSVERGAYDRALQTLREATAAYANGVEPREFYYLLGLVKLRQGDADSSALYLSEHMADNREQQRQDSLYGRSPGHWILRNEDIAGEFFADMGEYQKAYNRKNRALRILDSIYRAEKLSPIPSMQGRYLRAQLQQQNDILRNRMVMQWVIVALAFVAMVFFVLWLMAHRRQLILQQRQTILEYRQSIVRLRDAYAAEQSKPRIGIPQDLIDRRLDFMRKLLDVAVLYGNRSELFTRKIGELISSESEGGIQWVFEDILNMQQPGIVEFLKQRFPQLTDRELGLYSMICLDIPKSTICMVANISAKTYYNQRNILRGKLALTNNDVTFAEHFETMRQACEKAEKNGKSSALPTEGN